MSIKILFGSVFGVYALIVSMSIWLSKHMGKKNCHPQTDEIVYKDLCVKEHEKNEDAHIHITTIVTQAEARTEAKFVELKKDMRLGFEEVKTVIKEIATMKTK